MTTGPRLRLGRSLLPGVLAVALFAFMAAVVFTTPFRGMDAGGFPAGASITANIGYAMFDFTSLQAIPSESFIVAFFLIAVVLDAALDASLVLAKREEGGESVTALAGSRTTGGGAEGGSPPAAPAATDGGRSRPVDAVPEAEGGPRAADAGHRRDDADRDTGDGANGGDRA